MPMRITKLVIELKGRRKLAYVRTIVRFCVRKGRSHWKRTSASDQWNLREASWKRIETLLLDKLDKTNVNIRAQRPGFDNMKRESWTSVLIEVLKSILEYLACVGEISSSVCGSGTRWFKTASLFFACWRVSGSNKISRFPRAMKPDAADSALNESIFISHQDNGMPTTVDMSAAAETWKKMGPLVKC